MNTGSTEEANQRFSTDDSIVQEFFYKVGGICT
jgi:hypothetical protein